MKRSLTFGIVLVLLLAAVGTVSAANLVTNGGFESPPDAGVFTTMNTGLTSWTIEDGEIDLIGTHWLAFEPTQSIDLSGCERATISQLIQNTDPQKSYQLSFELSGNPYSGDTSSKTRTVEVYWDDDPARTYSFDTTIITSQTDDMHWQKITIPDLQATSSATTIKFIDVSPNSNTCVGAALDDVIVEEEEEDNNVPVPEFPTIALPAALIVGLIGVVLFIQKSKDN
ncbi:MAG: DUF642 domain-containing protein [Methanoregula sp.]|nr:DUF642 domain-containing protein [Methanoregula sp.]